MPTQYFGHPGATKIQSARSHKISLRICPMCLNCPLTKQDALDPSSLVQGSMKPSTPADPGAEYFEYHLSAFANSFELLLDERVQLYPAFGDLESFQNPMEMFLFQSGGSFIGLPRVAVRFFHAGILSGAPPDSQADTLIRYLRVPHRMSLGQGLG